MMLEVFEKKRIIMFAGSGGVGKTTVSAATGLGLALRGHKVLVVTVDPARRLADSLGVQDVGNKEFKIDLSIFDNYPNKGELHAMMMDTKRAADELIEKLLSKELAEKILDNRIYRIISDSLAGTQEYVALGKLFDLYRNTDYEIIVVDTAPTRYALDFFEAPTRLVDLLDANIIKILMMPADLIAGSGAKMIHKGAVKLFDILEKTIGLSIIAEISSFIALGEEAFGGLRERARNMQGILSDPNISIFNIVAAPNQLSIKDSLYIYNRLIELSMPFGAFILNRVHPHFIRQYGDPRLLHLLIRRLNELKKKQALDEEEKLVMEMIRGLQTTNAFAAYERKYIKELEVELRVEDEILQIPFFERDICDLTNLRRISEHLVSNSEQAT